MKDLDIEECSVNAAIIGCYIQPSLLLTDDQEIFPIYRLQAWFSTNVVANIYHQELSNALVVAKLAGYNTTHSRSFHEHSIHKWVDCQLCLRARTSQKPFVNKKAMFMNSTISQLLIGKCQLDLTVMWARDHSCMCTSYERLSNCLREVKLF